MSTAVAKGKKETTERSAKGAVTRSGDFPFFMSRLRDEFDELFNRFSRFWPASWQGDGWRWGIDVKDQDDAIVVHAEAPGFEPGDFDLQIRDNELVLRASRKLEKEEKEGGYREEEQRECYQFVTLPSGVDADKVTAKYFNGKLTVTLPKTPEGKGKRIPVKGS